MNGPSEETRALCLKRDRYECVRCGQPLDTNWSGHSLHHRRLRSHPFPGLHQPSNLICLCGSGTTGCHGWVHNHIKRAREYGWILPMTCQRPDLAPLWSARHGWILIDDHGNTHLTDRDGNPRTQTNPFAYTWRTL